MAEAMEEKDVVVVGQGGPRSSSSHTQVVAAGDAALIASVRAHPVLYDTRHARYCDINLKAAAWVKIGRQLNTTPKVCKSRWTNIRDNYRKCLKQYLSGVRLTQYKYSRELSFIDRFLVQKREGKREKDVEKRGRQEDEKAENDAGNDASNAASNDASNDASEDASNDARNDGRNDAINDACDDASNDASDDASNDASNNASDDASNDASNDAINDAKEEDEAAPDTQTDTSYLKIYGANEQSESEPLVEYNVLEQSPRRAPARKDPAQAQAVDAFLGALAPPLKDLSPYLLSLAKAELFAVVHKYELQGLRQRGWGGRDLDPLP